MRHFLQVIISYGWCYSFWVRLRSHHPWEDSEKDIFTMSFTYGIVSVLKLKGSPFNPSFVVIFFPSHLILVAVRESNTSHMTYPYS